MVRMAEVRGGRGAPGRGRRVAFLREYLRASGSDEPDVLLARVAAYRTVALARLAVRAGASSSRSGLRPALALLDDPTRGCAMTAGRAPSGSLFR